MNMIAITLHKEVAMEMVCALRGHIARLNEALELCSQNRVNEHTLHGIMDAVRTSEEALKSTEDKCA